MTNNANHSMMFSKEQLIKLIVPMIIEQVLEITVGMADMLMVSGAGEAAISGISLVNTICMLLIVVFTSMATGGSVVTSQYLGNGNVKVARETAKQLILICTIISVVISTASFLGNRFILRIIYGGVEAGVMNNAIVYFAITSLSFPFLAIYDACAALFRVMGNSKISMMTSFVMNGINIAGNAVLVYMVNMGVAGVAYSTLFARIIASFIIMGLLHKPVYDIHIDNYFKLGWSWLLMKKIFSIGIPQALENGIFQIGKLLTQSLIASFGTDSIAANACATTIEQLAFMPGSAMGLAMTTVIGHCVGASDYKQARWYANRLIKAAYIFLWGLNIAIIVLAHFIANSYNLSSNANIMAVQVIRYHSICCMAIWPLAFTLANVLRSAGDARYTMTVSILSMWLCRIGLAYLIGKYMGVGLLGVWIAETIDWAFRASFFVYRYKGNKWENKSVVEKTNLKNGFAE